MNNISADFKGSTRIERRILERLLGREATPSAIRYFAKHSTKLGDHMYWFLLGTLWVSYTGHSDLTLWRKLFHSSRPKRTTSIMKPNELEVFQKLPDEIPVYRAHRDGEEDWLSYTLSPQTAARFAIEKKVDKVSQWQIRKNDVIALFLRRGEQEVLMLDPSKATKVCDIEVRVSASGGN